jgi:hypothetical protein
MIIDDLSFEDRKDRAAGALLGMLTGDALGRFAKYLMDMEGSALSGDKFLKRVAEVEGLESVPVSMEALHILDIAEQFRKTLADVQTVVSEAHFAAEFDRIHHDRPLLRRAKVFCDKIDQPYKAEPFPKKVKAPSVESWGRLTRILATIIPLSVFAAGDNFSSIFYFEKLINWVNRDMQFHTKSLTICQAALLLAKLISISARKISDIQQLYKRRYYLEQLVWSNPGLDPYIFHALDLEGVITDPVFQKVRSDERIVSLANALHQYYRVGSFREGLLETISLGGDVQGNAAICGAVLGAVFGKSGIPAEWLTPGSSKGIDISGALEKSSAGKKGAARRAKERDQTKLYQDAEANAHALLASPAPEQDYIDALKGSVDRLAAGKSGPQREAEVEEIRRLLMDRFLDVNIAENAWKYPIVYGSKKFTSYTIYEIASIATFMTGGQDREKNTIAQMAEEGYLDILVDRLKVLRERALSARGERGRA